MDKNYFKAIDNLTPSQSALDRALQAARAEQSGKVIPMKTTKRKFTLLGAIAASLALIVTLSAVFFPSSVKTNKDKTKKEKNENVFFITANAAELKNYISDKSVIGAFAGSAGSSRILDFDNVDDNDPYNAGQYYKDGYADIFWNYSMSKLSVNGDNIKSVTVKSNKKGVYFDVSPMGDINESRNGDEDVIYVSSNSGKVVAIKGESYEEYEKSRKKNLKRYTDTDSIQNSQYTMKELKKMGDTIYCDGFTYNNKDKKKAVDFGRDLKLVIESNHSDSKIAGWLKELDEIEKEIIKCKYSHEMYEDLDNQRENLDGKIIKRTVKNATIDVTANFTDGTAQTKTLELDYYFENNDSFPWITIK